MRAEAARVHDPFRDPLVIEVEDLLAEVEVLERGGTAIADAQRVLIVGDGHSLRGGQDVVVGCDLMRFSTAR